MELNLKDIYKLAIKRKLTIVLVFFLHLVLSFAYIWNLPDRFSTSVLLQVQNIKGDSQPSASSLNSLLPIAGFQGSQGDDSKLAVELLKSKEVFRRILSRMLTLKKIFLLIRVLIKK